MMRPASLIYKQKIFKITLQNRNVEAQDLKLCSSELGITRWRTAKLEVGTPIHSVEPIPAAWLRQVSGLQPAGKSRPA